MINIYTIAGGSLMSNCYILEENNNVILIDFVPEVEGVIEKNKYKIDKLLLTHTHFDHIEGLSKFQENHSIDIYLSKEGLSFFKNPNSQLLQFFPDEIISNYKNIKLDQFNILNDEDVILWNEHKIEIVKSPGHSPDCLMFIVDEIKSVFTGDTIFYGSVGRTDLPGGNFDVMLKSINKLFNIVDDDYKLYPGHGPSTNVDFEKRNNQFLI